MSGYEHSGMSREDYEAREKLYDTAVFIEERWPGQYPELCRDLRDLGDTIGEAPGAQEDELVRWLGEQLDEDERIAKEAGGHRAEWRLARPLDDAEMGDASWLRPPYLKHVERHDPARVLREIDAKRRLVALHVRAHHQCVAEDGPTQWHAADPCATLRLLALPYADRPDYREEWRP